MYLVDRSSHVPHVQLGGRSHDLQYRPSALELVMYRGHQHNHAELGDTRLPAFADLHLAWLGTQPWCRTNRKCTHTHSVAYKRCTRAHDSPILGTSCQSYTLEPNETNLSARTWRTAMALG